ncbi:MAG: hypothetical protein M2R45_02913 [Verrucomicrobia subdivision 3 bacterium]|nr:hypothetical protein [Limisphaerales bacterium]MCS1415365.1 hypothetical protein [Limisphaerales bacterium]
MGTTWGRNKGAFGEPPEEIIGAQTAAPFKGAPRGYWITT